MFLSRFMPCTECGASVERAQTVEHRCDPERLLDFRMFGLMLRGRMGPEVERAVRLYPGRG